MQPAHPLVATATSEVVWYLSYRLTDAERRAFADAAGGVVLSGQAGLRAAFGLKRDGYSGRLWVDPARWAKAENANADTLLGDLWRTRQQELEVTELISPGSFVDDGDEVGLRRAVECEAAWANEAGGRVSLCLHNRWLTRDLGTLVAALQELAMPLALAFGVAYDPLDRRGAVRGLVEVLRSCSDVAVLRCDIGAIGAVANGAALGAVGTAGNVRHGVPAHRSGGGSSDDTSPTVFIEQTLSFKRGSLLESLPPYAGMRCWLECCEGSDLRRFATDESAPQAMRHNRMAIGNVAGRVLANLPALRPQAFSDLCADAIAAASEWSVRAEQLMDVRHQVEAWARLGGR
ncbi:MAG: hypothetical protein F4Y12_06565 [Acidimicrobiaceae bacterium]|nr:hypothetical protein [Acidimicrobiaceae bacterium]